MMTLEQDLASGALVLKSIPTQQERRLLQDTSGQELLAFPATGGIRILGVLFSAENLEDLRELLENRRAVLGPARKE